ncbi:uncharacterized protein LOC133318964 [Danaus plexippus]|uniref:uncharacterized protein LOC133318964 n=1 Tax=Danaus plexippus TaxID=13037 RepID=UPI002AB166A8|nr:uncharacterized protein LOC133318964 [Danaus plexippus]
MVPTIGERVKHVMHKQVRDTKMNNKITVKSREYNTDEKISKPLRFFFIVNQIFASLDFGFKEYKTNKMRLLSKLGVIAVSLIQGTIIIVFLFIKMNFFYPKWVLKLLLEYYSYVLILIFTPDDRTFCFYLMELQYFDEQMGIQSSSYKIDFKIIVFWCVSSITDATLMWINYLTSDKYINLLTLNGLLYIVKRTCTLPLILLFFVFYSMLCRLLKLKLYINNKKISVLRALELYRFLIDAIEKVIGTFKYIYIVYLIFNVPGVMASLFELIKLMISDENINYLKAVTPYFDTLVIIIILIIPTITATILSQETLNIKLILHNRVLEEVDENEIELLENMIHYIEARPFKFFMLSLVPMDAMLVIILFNFSINYLIVLIQITHVL